MSIVSLVIAPTLAKIHHDKIERNRKEKMESLILMDNNALHQNTNTLTNDLSGNSDTNVIAEEEDPEIRRLVRELSVDGLITNTSDYSVSVISGRLYINGVKQNSDVNNKYKRLFRNKDDFTYEVKTSRL